ncbi:MAG TPA: response regulator [Candidatus Acidoferrales bacterium]|nr:response regulator [Candidatus Acidoferrales bacterium]
MRHILLVDDDPIQLRTREAILRSAGLMVSIATSVESAAATMRTLAKHIGMVITDHLLKGTTGVSLVQQVRSRASHIPVLVLTGFPEAEADYEGLNVIVRHKPLPPEELIALAQKALDVNDPNLNRPAA